MKKCPKCGSVFEDAYLCCTACGTPLEQVSTLKGRMGGKTLGGAPAEAGAPKGVKPEPIPEKSITSGRLKGKVGNTEFRPETTAGTASASYTPSSPYPEEKKASGVPPVYVPPTSGGYYTPPSEPVSGSSPEKKTTNTKWIPIVIGIAAALVLTILTAVIISSIQRKNDQPTYGPARVPTAEPTRRSADVTTPASPTTPASRTTPVPTTTTARPTPEPTTTEAPFVNQLPAGDYNHYYLKSVEDAKGGWYCTFEAYSQCFLSDKDVNGLKTDDVVYLHGNGNYYVLTVEQNMITLYKSSQLVPRVYGRNDDLVMAYYDQVYLIRNNRGHWLAIGENDGDPLTYYIGETTLFVTKDATFINDTVQNNARVSSPNQLWYYSDVTGQYDTDFPVKVEITIKNGKVTFLKSLFHP